MTLYPPEVNLRFLAPFFNGKAEGANAVGTSASFECGCFVRFTLRIEPEALVINEARFMTNGCGYMSAAADAVCDRLAGAELGGLHSLDEDQFKCEVEARVGIFPGPRTQCIHVVLEALRAAFSDYRSYRIEEFRGETPLICTCFGVSEETIEEFVDEHAPDSVDQVAASCRAGSGCGSCRMMIQDILDSRP